MFLSLAFTEGDESNEGKSDIPFNVHVENYHEGGSLPVLERHVLSDMGLAERAPLDSTLLMPV